MPNLLEMISKTLRLNNEERMVLFHGLKLMEEQQNYPKDLPPYFRPEDLEQLTNKIKP